MKMDYHCNLNRTIFSILFLNSMVFSLPSSDISTKNLFNSLTSSVEKIKIKSTDIACTYTDLTSLCDSISKQQQFVYSVLLADTAGVVHFETKRAQKKVLTGVNVKNSRWFSNVLTDKKTEHTEIVKIDNK